MSSETIIRYCAPTLAGLKVGNLFTFEFESIESLLDSAELQNRALNPKGVYAVIVRIRNNRALVYVYRKRQLERLLAERSVQNFLRKYGHSEFTVEACLNVLRQRLLREDFPHDIGVFLGYPLADIQAFINNKGANCPCCGCWKAYTNIAEAQKTFKKFKACTADYCRRYLRGIDITRLTVSG